MIALLALHGEARADAPECDVSVTTLNFPAYDPSAPFDDTGVSTISIDCNKERKLEIGLYTSDQCTQRYLRGPQNTRMNYQLYQDAGYQIVWGTKKPKCGDVVDIDEKMTAVRVTVYGRVPRQQTVVAGTYTDTVTVEVDF
ncbi:MAG: spore coat protein U domain-containing protein [Candidatus Eremiobacteraeota bacterium]|nr:spore coat protein U domain-containing protein [Candidatus Eremiobacteraeota bacterium]